MQPDYLFISTWNEHIAQPQALAVPPYGSMGLESDTSSAQLGFVGKKSVLCFPIFSRIDTEALAVLSHGCMGLQQSDTSPPCSASAVLTNACH